MDFVKNSGEDPGLYWVYRELMGIEFDINVGGRNTVLERHFYLEKN
jgi:hypothetical protein